MNKRAKPKAEFVEIIPVTIEVMITEIESRSLGVPAVIKTIMQTIQESELFEFTEYRE